MFWKDRWSGQTQNLQSTFPESFSFAKQQSIAVDKAIRSESFLDLFNLPLSEVAFNQVVAIQQRIELIDLEDVNDV